MTRKQLFARASFLGVKIVEGRDGPYRSFHAWAPRGKIFAGSTCHNTQLGDFVSGEKPYWAAMSKEIELENCGEPGCDYCNANEK